MADLWLLSAISPVIGGVALFVMLFKAKSAKEPDDFSALPMYMFYCLSAVAGSIITAVTFFPEQFAGTDLPVFRMLQSNNGTQWVLSIGGVDQADTLGIQIPLFIIILGTLGSYVRYLYLGIPEFKSKFRKSFNKYQQIKSLNANKIKWIENILKNIPANDPDLPPAINAAYEREMISYELQKDRLQSESNERRYELSFDVSNDFLRTTGLFLLGPLLAVMAWLILQVSGTENNWVFAVTSLTVGFTASSIIRRARSIVEDKLSDHEENEKEPVISLDKDAERPGKKVAITGSGFDKESKVAAFLADVVLSTEPSVITTNAKGGFSAKVTVPDMENGEYKLKVEDNESNEASSTFNVIVALLSLDKVSEKAGAIVTATGSNFAASSSMSLFYDDQKLATEPAPVSANDDGSFSAKFEVPASAAGEHKVTATDGERNSAAATFTVSQ